MDAIRVERRSDGVAVVVFDRPGKAVNTLSPEVLKEVEEKVVTLLDDRSVKALVLVSAKPDNFIAGADLDVLDQAGGPEAAARLSRDGNAALSRLASSPKPVVAAIHGPALGGGLEVALACRYILASNHPATVLGLPEVMLGLLPAGGGIHRLVRRVGLTRALPLLLTGKRLRAKKAYRLGLVDALTTPGGLAETGARAALALAEGKLKTKPRKKPLIDRLASFGPVRDFVLKKARRQVMGKTRGLYPAPLKILECLEAGLKHGLDRGIKIEPDLFGGLVASPESRQLVWLFKAMNEAKKDRLPAEPKKVGRVAVLGAGFMGEGIAAVSVGLGPVVVRDIADKSLAGCAKGVSRGLAKQVKSGAITRAESDRRWSRLHLTKNVEDLAGSDIVIEAVFEDLDLKRRVLAEIEGVIDAEAVFASNTSALPIGEIAAQARHPERVLGMHYFSPVPKMPLLEIIRADKTSDQAVATAQKLGQKQGKTVIVVKDRPGFYTTRILAPYLSEAIVLMDEGARIEDVDRAMKDFGYPVGPLTLLDEVGIDIGAHVSKNLSQAFSAYGSQGADGLNRLYEAGYHGRKNGLGFYAYGNGKKKGGKQANPQIYSLFAGKGRRSIAPREIQDRIALLMVNEAVTCLQEGVVASPRDGDIGAILGLGFPPFRGGPFHYLDIAGAGSVAESLARLAETNGPRYAPAGLLTDMARAGRKFYG